MHSLGRTLIMLQDGPALHSLPFTDNIAILGTIRWMYLVL